METLKASALATLPKVTVDPAFVEALGRLSETPKLSNTEVSHRPARQQCRVRTP